MIGVVLGFGEFVEGRCFRGDFFKVYGCLMPGTGMLDIVMCESTWSR